jgi:hypothetical protein
LERGGSSAVGSGRAGYDRLLLDVYVQLNMFRASSRPSSGAQQLQQQQPLVLPSERGGSSAVGRDRAGRLAGPTTTNSTATTTLQRYNQRLLLHLLSS